MMKLGWRWSRSKDFTGPDQRPARDTFMELQRFMTWPYVLLRFDGTFDLDGTLDSPPWVPKSAATSPFVPGDPYSLWRSSSETIQVPQDFDTWLAIGSATVTTTGGAAAALLTYGWRINGVNADYFSHQSGNPASRHSVPFMAPVRKGDFIEVVVASNDAAEDMTDGDVALYFLPLA